LNSWLHKANELEEFRPLYLLYNLVNLFYEGYLIIMENFNSAKRLLNILQDCKSLKLLLSQQKKLGIKFLK